jgi:hypothetical protein
MDLMSLALEADEEISTLRRTVRELEQVAEADKSLVLEQGMYWLPEGQGRKQGPYCPACWGKDRKLVPMLIKETARQGVFWAVCQVHQVDNITFTL